MWQWQGVASRVHCMMMFRGLLRSRVCLSNGKWRRGIIHHANIHEHIQASYPRIRSVCLYRILYNTVKFAPTAGALAAALFVLSSNAMGACVWRASQNAYPRRALECTGPSASCVCRRSLPDRPVG